MTKIFVSNILYQATETEIRAVFEPYGTVRSVSIGTEYQSGRSRGFAFLDMPNEAEAQNAIAAPMVATLEDEGYELKNLIKLPGTVREEFKRRVA